MYISIYLYLYRYILGIFEYLPHAKHYFRYWECWGDVLCLIGCLAVSCQSWQSKMSSDMLNVPWGQISLFLSESLIQILDPWNWVLMLFFIFWNITFVILKIICLDYCIYLKVLECQNNWQKRKIPASSKLSGGLNTGKN